VPDVASAGADLDLRLVRYFTVVAEQLNFGRAAAVLHVAQPSLSRQIQRLEDQLGVRLLERTPQGSRLTEAGQAFLPEARALLHTARHAIGTARAAAPLPAITIGYVEDLVITPAVRAFRSSHPGVEVRTRHLDGNDATALAEHRVDAIIARMPLPYPTDRLRVTGLYEEPRVLVVPIDHRLAGKESVRLNDIAADAVVGCSATTTVWREFWRLEPRPDGSPAPVGPLPVESYEDKLELVADGQAIAVLPAGDRRVSLRDDLTTVPLEGVAPTRVVVVTRAGDHHPLITAFRECARTNLVPAQPEF
jgi:DNA-binding transcriptional LysR family regulator